MRLRNPVRGREGRESEFEDTHGRVRSLQKEMWREAREEARRGGVVPLG
jgi:hypothetical protein